jgi:hypothetical protein
MRAVTEKSEGKGLAASIRGPCSCRCRESLGGGVVEWQADRAPLHDDDADKQEAQIRRIKRRAKSAKLVGMETNESKKRLKTLERAKGIEPSYSAWKSRNTAMFSTTVLTFSVFLTY